MSGGEHHPKHCTIYGNRLNKVVHKRRKENDKYINDTKE
jgi:hypothetical protein